ncbi:hypothetical protein TWF718_005346 [Orbilia javanica]|uniref:Uncharacterized protein n=1 Tax=Orbilia javanica TaxID=47235 RepID=A0AAN8N7H8_9PEZI
MCWTIYYCSCTHPYPKPSVSDACHCDIYRVSSLKWPCLACRELDRTEDREEDRDAWAKQVGQNELLVKWLSSGGNGKRWFDDALSC